VGQTQLVSECCLRAAPSADDGGKVEPYDAARVEGPCTHAPSQTKPVVGAGFSPRTIRHAPAPCYEPPPPTHPT
jgi:hypothetical protein